MSLRRMMCTQLATEGVEPPAALVTSPDDERDASAQASVRAALTPEVVLHTPPTSRGRFDRE